MRKRPHETGQGGGKSAAVILPSANARRIPNDPKPSAPTPDPGKTLGAQDPVVLLAMCLFGEARGESDAALRAVAQVVLNRASHPHPVFGSRAGAPWEENLRRVILRPGQFSCFHPADPNYAKLLRPQEAEDAVVWARCLRCAEQAIAARHAEDRLTANSDHYFDDSIQPPSWADPAKRTVKLGWLNFYRLYLPPPGAATPLAVSRVQPADSPHTQEPPEAEPPSAAGSSEANASDGRSSLAAGPGKPGSPHAMSLPRRVLSCAWISRLPKLERALRAGRLSSPRAVTSDQWKVTSLRTSHFRSLLGHHLSLVTRHLSLLFCCLLLAGCNEFERAAYRTLAVTKAEYETMQSHVAEAAAHGLITEDQWNRFSAEGHRFIAAHNAAVDSFELWSRVKSPSNQARVEALLEILPRLIRELNSLAESLESEPRPEGSGQARDSGLGIRDSVFSRIASPDSRIPGPLAYARGSD